MSNTCFCGAVALPQSTDTEQHFACGTHCLEDCWHESPSCLTSRLAAAKADAARFEYLVPLAIENGMGWYVSTSYIGGCQTKYRTFREAVDAAMSKATEAGT